MSDEFRHLRAFSQQQTDVYEDIDQDVRDLLAAYDELAAQVAPVGSVIPDRLQNLMDDQKRLMGFLGIPKLTEGEEYLASPIFKSAVDGLVTEGAEVLDAISVMTKPWKQAPIEVVRENVLEESTDVLFMLLEVYLLAGLSADDIVEIYERKLTKNLGRLLAVSNGHPKEASGWRDQLHHRTEQRRLGRLIEVK